MTRMTLDLTDEIDDKLSDIAKRQGVSKAEIMRRAFALLSVADSEIKKGNSLAVVREGPNHQLQTVARLVGIF